MVKKIMLVAALVFPLFLSNANAEDKTVSVKWSWEGDNTLVDGFRLYLNKVQVCEFGPALRHADCTVNVTDVQIWEMTAYSGENESIPGLPWVIIRPPKIEGLK